MSQFSFYKNLIQFKNPDETDSAFAKRIGIERQRLFYWKRYSGFPAWETLQSIAVALDVHPQEILSERRTDGSQT